MRTPDNYYFTSSTKKLFFFLYFLNFCLGFLWKKEKKKAISKNRTMLVKEYTWQKTISIKEHQGEKEYN